MDFLRKLYPTVFKLEKKNTRPFVYHLIAFVVIGIIASVLCAIINWLLGDIKVVGTIVGIVLWTLTTVIDIYCTGGIVCSILKFTGVIKDTNE